VSLYNKVGQCQFSVMPQDMYRSQFRLPYPLYEDLKAAADNNHRSLNAEIVARLEKSFMSSNIPSAEYLLLASDEEMKEAADDAWSEIRRIADVVIKRTGERRGDS